MAAEEVIFVAVALVLLGRTGADACVTANPDLLPDADACPIANADLVPPAARVGLGADFFLQCLIEGYRMRLSNGTILLVVFAVRVGGLTPFLATVTFGAVGTQRVVVATAVLDGAEIVILSGLH